MRIVNYSYSLINRPKAVGGVVLTCMLNGAVVRCEVFHDDKYFDAVDIGDTFLADCAARSAAQEGAAYMAAAVADQRNGMIL